MAEVKLDQNRLDYVAFDLMTQVMGSPEIGLNPNPLKAVALLRYVYGDKYAAFMDECRAEDGTIPADVPFARFLEQMNESGVKNS